MKDLDTIYCAARELPPGERSAYLDEACRGDAGLRVRVEKMLAVADDAEAFITDPLGLDEEERIARGGSERDSAEAADDIIGDRVGRYRILERVGEGGCGIVYVAEQTEPVRRRVALKVIKPGMDTAQVVARFEAERQALAMMEHPNIAKVLDAGTSESGRPYFVMELVRGTRITEYCDEADLGTRERLDLFIKVCQAVQHAHQKGVIHRDLKPSNILVTMHDGVPVPKVIDFGIAKATEGRLTDATVYTQLQQFIGTPAYMSPEQAEMSGLDIDTRSDIYSLGVLLYELLTGSTPFDTTALLAAGLDAMRKTIREKAPVRPSTRLRQTTGAGGARTVTAGGAEAPRGHGRRMQELMHQLKGDLDWIVMKCLEKDRTRRYETANALAMDIGRHLNMEPVMARPPSRMYEFQKTVRRHRFGFAAAAAVMIVLTAGILTSTWLAMEAIRARNDEVTQRVEAQHARAHAMAQQKLAEEHRKVAEEQLERAEWLVYAGKLTLAHTDFEDGTGALAKRYLDECQEERRGWEHRYLRTRLEPEQTLVGHLVALTSVAFSTDGKRIVTGSEDGTARVWDAATGKEILPPLTGHRSQVTSVAFSPVGNRVVTGAETWTGSNDAPGEVMVWDAATGEALWDRSDHAASVSSVAFSPDGKRIVSGSMDGAAMVWNSGTGEEIWTVEPQGGRVWSVAFSPDGRFIATGCEDQTARVWDASTFEEVRAFGGRGGRVRAVAFSPDGAHLVTGSLDGAARVWDIATGEEVFPSLMHSDQIWSVAYSPDGKRIVTGCRDETAKVWDAATGREILTLKGQGGIVRGVAFSPDGSRVLTGSVDGTAKLWDAERGQEIPVLAGGLLSVFGIAFSPDGRRLVAGNEDGKAIVWGVEDGEALLRLEGHDGGIRSVAFGPDGTRIVSGSEDRTARVWDAVRGTEIPGLRLEHGSVVSGVAFSPDGRRILTGSGVRGSDDPGEAALWDADTGEQLRSISLPGAVWSVAFNPDGKLIALACGDRTARVCDATLQNVREFGGHTHWVTSVAFSPDGKRLLTGSTDHTAKVWDTETWLELVTLEGHTGPVCGVAFSPDGSRIVTVGDDRTAKVWESRTGQELLSLKHEYLVWSLAFSPDGTRIATGIAGAGGTVRLWQAAPAQ